MLEHLEIVAVSHDPATEPTRFPVQYVIHPQSAEYPNWHGCAGQIVSGVLRVGQRVTVLPSGLDSTVKAIDTLGRHVDLAWAPQSVTVHPADASPSATRTGR